MEGYLLVKESSGGLLNRSAWNKRWFVLDKATLQAYDEFDQKADRPTSIRGEAVNVNGCDIKVLPKDKYDFVLEISPPTALARPTVLVRAETDALCQTWLTALNNAAVGSPPDRQALALQSHYAALGLVPPLNPARAELQSHEAYTALARQAEETQASAESVQRLKDAYAAVSGESLVSSPYYLVFPSLPVSLSLVLISHRLTPHTLPASIRDSKWIEYSCVVRKTERGLGLKIVEAPHAGLLVTPTEVLSLVSISGTDAIRPGDWLVRVGEDDSSEWPLNRLVHRTAPFRLPVGKEVALGLKRRAVASSADSAAIALLTNTPRQEREVAPPAPMPPSPAPIFAPRPAAPLVAPSSFSPSPLSYSHPSSSSASSSSTANPADAALFSAQTRELHALQQQHAQLQDAHRRVQEEAREETSRLTALLQAQTLQTQKQERVCEGLYRQLQQCLVVGASGAPASEAAVMEALQAMVLVCSQLTTGARRLALSADGERLLSARGLGEGECKGEGAEAAERRHMRAALGACVSTDTTKQMLEKWESRGTSAQDKLRRLAERVSKLDPQLLYAGAPLSPPPPPSPSQPAQGRTPLSRRTIVLEEWEQEAASKTR